MMIFSKRRNPFLFLAFSLALSAPRMNAQDYKIVDTDQSLCYDTLHAITPPTAGMAYYGQDAQHNGYQPSYTDKGDGTVMDNITGLMWQQSPDMDGDGDIDYDDKMSFDEAMQGASAFNLAGYSDWRLPTIKELYSLIMFSGLDPSGYNGTSVEDLVPFIDTEYFDFAYGDESAGERIIDAQFATETVYVGIGGLSGNDELMFGVNFADGRIKGYPTGTMPGQTTPKQFYVLYVRGNSVYGINELEDNGDGTVTDHATGLMWMKNDNGQAVSWENALAYAENYTLAGHDDWRLPNAKELQSIVDYSRAPSVSASAAIDPKFNATMITDEGGNNNYPFYWTSTTHASWTEDAPGGAAAYVCFGEALGWMEQPPNSGNYNLLDVHGAGAQRSDYKFGDPENYPYGHGPQGDVVRIYHYVRLVRDAEPGAGTSGQEGGTGNIRLYPNPATDEINLVISGAAASKYTIKVVDLTGQVKRTEEAIGAGNLHIPLSTTDLASGLYFLVISSAQGMVIKKFVRK